MSLWNYTIDDASPYLTYTPYGDSLVGNGGWRTWYIGSQYATSPDETTQGNSFHITSSNANVSFQFFGTNVALYGYTNSSFNVVIDNGPPTTVNSSIPEDSLLYSSDTLTNQLHSITLSAQPTNNLTQNLAFDSAIVSVPLDDNEGSPSPTFYDSTNTTLFMYAGDWTSQTQNGVPNSTVTAPFYQTTQVNASVLFAFNGAEAVVVKGLATSENGMYSVSLDGQTSIYNGTSLWILPDALLYFRAGLDPTITHELNITNLSNKLCLNSITVFQYEARNAAPSVITP
ncbi:hypothetical protein H0H92_006817 [Tricholoma furcatifolium]|nr:hypothetical protein H0H92_006817 [Tricholoma furcatifolium]